MRYDVARGLSSEQVAKFRERGFTAPVDVFTADEIAEFDQKIAELEQLLEPAETAYAMDGWEKHNDWLYRLVMNERLLDCIEDLLGPNFYQWGSNMMNKPPHEALYVPWHQDLHDWPLWPNAVLTAWIALDDADEENGCMRMLSGSHRLGKVHHVAERPPPRAGSRALLPFEVDASYVDRAAAVPVRLRRGQVSFHDALIIHGSDGNTSERRRGAFTACYAATHVRCVRPERDGNGDWTQFGGFLCRGTDAFGNIPLRKPPTTFGRGPRKAYRELRDLT